MTVKLLCFTDAGAALGQRILALLAGDEVEISRSGEEGLTAAGWAQAHFHHADALLFIGAAGIAVRSIAPLLDSKTTDPAVIVIDEAGRYCIPILSGHLGGANLLARQLARGLGAQAVLTTATDARGVFAADSWARGNGLLVANPEQIRAVSAKGLAGEEICLFSRFPLQGVLPAGVRLVDADAPADVRVDIRRPAQGPPLWLVPKAVWLGIGCRRGTSAGQIEALYQQLLEEESLHPKTLLGVATIDLKRREPGLLAFCAKHALPLRAYSATTLDGLIGDFTASPFVESTTGVDNVCERSAMMRGDELIVRKRARDGVTMALAVQKTTLWFTKE